ncbi:MAG TPA: hypothetical protein VGN15_05170 [Ktedonobacteraceae bacterium]|nr:hypothetical protein [Ktedonobacteraceae bacterium]
MNNKRPYTHILKNLFHEQATEIIPLLLPKYRVEQVLNIELPELKSTYIEGSPGKFEEGLVELALPGATLLGVYQTEWIEHSGNFERAYRANSSETDKPIYLLIEFQTEREDEKLSHRLMCNFAFVNRYVDNDTEQEDEDAEQEDEDVEDEDAEQEDEDVEDEQKGTVRTTYVYPAVLCPFPQSVPAPVHDTFAGKVIHIFNFEVLGLWEKDAREFLNMHVSAIYFLLPAMKNADATLLGLAIEELAQRFQNDDIELGRHLTGLYLLLQQSDTMLEEEKLAAQEHLKRFMHLIKNDPYEEP